MKRFVSLILVTSILGLTGCLSIYRSINSSSINNKFRTDGYYSSVKNFTIFNKKNSSYIHLQFLDTENKRLLFAHSKYPIPPSGKILKGSRFDATYKLNYNSDSDNATLTFSKSMSSFANYTGRISMIVNIKVSDEGNLEGFIFHPKHSTKATKIFKKQKPKKVKRSRK